MYLGSRNSNTNLILAANKEEWMCGSRARGGTHLAYGKLSDF
jgi:hypothetical protein